MSIYAIPSARLRRKVFPSYFVHDGKLWEASSNSDFAGPKFQLLSTLKSAREDTR
jgi:hypothetical protein